MTDTPDTPIELRTLRDGHTVQAIPVDDLRVGDRMRFGGSTRGIYYDVDAIVEKPKTRQITIRIGPWEGTETLSLRRSRLVLIAPRRRYEASIVHDDRTDIYIIDSYVAITPGEAREILDRELATHAGKPVRGTIVAGEMVPDDDERVFVPDRDAEYIDVPTLGCDDGAPHG